MSTKNAVPENEESPTTSKEACCAPAEQRSCCMPEAKAECCGEVESPREVRATCGCK